MFSSVGSGWMGLGGGVGKKKVGDEFDGAPDILF